MAKSESESASIGGSYKIANEVPKRRMIVALDGLEKQGKTHFALTMPGPIVYQNFDIGTEGVLDKFQSSKTIHLASYTFNVAKGMSSDAIVSLIEPIWARYVEDYHLAIKKILEGVIRGGITDTATEGWETLRLARLGKLTQVMPHHYTALNTEFRNLIREIFNTSGNWCFLHKLKSEWKEGAGGKANKTGNYERSGFADMGFLVQVNALAWRDKDGEFHITVKDCRQNPKVAGLDLMGSMATWPWLGVHVFPESNLEDWE